MSSAAEMNRVLPVLSGLAGTCACRGRQQQGAGEVSALAEGCPRERAACGTMARDAARYGHSELVNWSRCRERGFKMDERGRRERQPGAGVAVLPGSRLRPARGREEGRGPRPPLSPLAALPRPSAPRSAGASASARLRWAGKAREGWAERKKLKLQAGHARATDRHGKKKILSNFG